MKHQVVRFLLAMVVGLCALAGCGGSRTNPVQTAPMSRRFLKTSLETPPAAAPAPPEGQP